MDFNQHTTPNALEKYAFWWSEARLAIAAVALAIGGVPPVWYLVSAAPALFGIVKLGLTLSWVISGLVSLYLIYRWNEKKMLFGGKDMWDTVAFFIMVVTGINLGVAGIAGQNFGMTIASGRIIFLVAAALYLIVASYMYRRWSANGNKIF